MWNQTATRAIADEALYSRRLGGGGTPASLITYTPAVPTNWIVVPTTVQGALDELAEPQNETQLAPTGAPHFVLPIEKSTYAELDGGAVRIIFPGGVGHPFTVPYEGERHTVKNFSANTTNALTIIAGVDVEDPTNPGVYATNSVAIVGSAGFAYTYEYTGTNWAIIGSA